MKRRLVCLLLSVTLMLMQEGCSVMSKSEELIIPDGYTLIKVEETTGTKVAGLGVEFDPHYFSQNVTRNVSGIDENGWETICSRVIKMGVNKFRVMVLPEWIEPENDNEDSNTINWDKMTVNSLEMQSLYRVLDLAQENDIDVTLVMWGVSKNTSLASNNYASKKYFMAEGNNATNWVVGAKGAMVNEWCENFSAMVQHLINTKQYTCIKEITPGNEPDWSYQIDGNMGDIDAYLDMCVKLDERFREDGIRNKVEFNIGDATDVRSHVWLDSCAENLNGIVDIMNSHTYIFGYNTSNSTVIEWEEKNVMNSMNCNSNHFIGEFGSDKCVGSTRASDIDTFSRGVLLTRLLCNFFNAGACGASYWSLMDQYYNKSAAYGQMMQTGLWKSAKAEYVSESYYNSIKGDFEVRPQYYAYSLMTKYISKGADVYPLEINENLVAGSKFIKDGQIVIVIANNSDDTKNYSIDIEGNYNIVRYLESSLPEDDSLIGYSESVSRNNGCVSFSVPKDSTIVLVKQ